MEVLLSVAVIGVLALFLVPRMLCALEKARFVKTLSEVTEARDVVESYMLDSAYPPVTLEQACQQIASGKGVPPNLLYCSGWEFDGNKGHGNDCDFYDEENPGKSNPSPETAGTKYIMRTVTDLAPRCMKVDFVWLRCCNAAPEIVKTGEWKGPLPIRTTGKGGGKGSK
ncbi:MAG: type II secretion system protein [Thermoanaerobaculia bacterium]